MEKKHKIFYPLLFVSALGIICFVAVIYIRQMGRTISDNITSSVREIAEHDKAAIQAYVEICWEDLYEINDRFISYGCKTINDIEKRLCLECNSSGFTSLYLLAEDGTVYTDKDVTYSSGSSGTDFLTYFANGEDKVIVRYDEKNQDGRLSKESILYGARIDNLKVEGISMSALIGISDITSIQNNLVIDNFIKDGKSRGHSALIDMKGDYIVNVNKEIYHDKHDNLYTHLSESANSALTNEEVARKLSNSETFSFSHSHYGEKNSEIYYFIPFESGIGLYFLMSVNEEVFMEQTSTFIIMSMIMLVACIITVITMLLIVMALRSKTIRTTEKAKSQKEFLSNMSHEIRTPLNGLIGINHLMMVHIDDDSQKPQIKEWLKKSHSTAKYLLSLVNDILDMSKLQSGKVDIINEPLMAEKLIDEVATMQAGNIESKGIEFIVEKDITEPCIEGDATRTKQILMNIVGNAAKFTPNGGYIKLSAVQKKTDAAHVVTTYKCEDSGIGISKEYIGRIFDSFSQERNRNTDGIKGTGLGMAISKQLASAMGGDITVESELNIGSVFTVAIPSLIVKDIPDYLKEDEEENNGAVNRLHEKQGEGRPVKILVAEDVELNAEVLLEILEMEGFETAHAKNGREAADMFQQSETGEFDIILMDMQMPVLDGCAASREIRKMDRPDAKSVIIYACTANTFQEDRDMAIKSGMDGFLSKPVDVDVLLKKVAKPRNKDTQSKNA